MQRKDVKIGFAIGSALLFLVILWMIVASGEPKNTEVTLADDPAPASPSATQQPAPQQNKPSTSGNGAQPSPSPSPANPASDGTLASNANAQAPKPNGGAAPSGEDKWARALNEGKLELMVRSETPQIQPNGNSADPGPASATPAPAATDSTVATGTNTGAAGNPAQPQPQAQQPQQPDPFAPAAPAQQPGTPNASTGTATGADATGAGAGGGINAAFSGIGTPATTQPASSAAPAAGQRTHVVQRNETFASIAQMIYGNESYYPHLLRANPNIDPKKLRPGMTIVIPDPAKVVATTDPNAAGGAAQAASATQGPALDATREYRVQPNDSLYKIALKLYGKAEKQNALYEANKDAIGPNPSRLKVGMVLKLPEPPTSTANATPAGQ